jgi:hypothetical protein
MMCFLTGSRIFATDEDNDMSSSRLGAGAASPPRQFSDSKAEAGDNGSEALRILEGLKAKPRTYRSGSSGMASSMSIGDDASVVSDVSTISRPSMGRWVVLSLWPSQSIIL